MVAPTSNCAPSLIELNQELGGGRRFRPRGGGLAGFRLHRFRRRGLSEGWFSQEQLRSRRSAARAKPGPLVNVS